LGASYRGITLPLKIFGEWSQIFCASYSLIITFYGTLDLALFFLTFRFKPIS
jgi:hypothetical protein